MTERVDRLIEAGRRAAERADRERRQASAAGPAPRPGDLYALPATAEHDVEWLVVAAADGGRWLLLPADLDGTGGTADVEVPADEPGGPLTVYGRFPVTVPPALLPDDLRTGRLSEERRAEAERRWRDLAAGAEPPEHEGDFDPDYRRRLVQLAAAQRALSAAAAAAERGDPGGGPGGGAPAPGDGPTVGREEGAGAPQPVPFVRPATRRRLPPPWLTALAAVLALAVVALAGWNLSLLRQVERLSGPRQVVPGAEVRVDEIERGSEVSLPAAEWVLLSVAWNREPDPAERFRLRVLAPNGEELAALAVRPRGNEADVELPGGLLRPGGRIVLDRLGDDGGAEQLLELVIRLESD